MWRFLVTVFAAGCAAGGVGLFVLQGLQIDAGTLGRMAGVGIGMLMTAAVIALPWRALQAQKSDKPFRVASLVVAVLMVGFLFDQMGR